MSAITECSDTFAEDSWRELREFRGSPHELLSMTLTTIRCAEISLIENTKEIQTLLRDNLILRNRLHVMKQQSKQLASQIFQDTSIRTQRDVKIE
jgi:hypothetical protein